MAAEDTDYSSEATSEDLFGALLRRPMTTWPGLIPMMFGARPQLAEKGYMPFAAGTVGPSRANLRTLKPKDLNEIFEAIKTYLRPSQPRNISPESDRMFDAIRANQRANVPAHAVNPSAGSQKGIEDLKDIYRVLLNAGHSVRNYPGENTLTTPGMPLSFSNAANRFPAPSVGGFVEDLPRPLLTTRDIVLGNRGPIGDPMMSLKNDSWGYFDAGGISPTTLRDYLNSLPRGSQ